MVNLFTSVKALFERPAKVTTPVATVKPADVRTWARANGFEVADRGRLSTDIHTAYESAHK